MYLCLCQVEKNMTLYFIFLSVPTGVLFDFKTIVQIKLKQQFYNKDYFNSHILYNFTQNHVYLYIKSLCMNMRENFVFSLNQ